MAYVKRIVVLANSFNHTREDLFADAYALQEKRIGYDSAAEARELESATG